MCWVLWTPSEPPGACGSPAPFERTERVGEEAVRPFLRLRTEEEVASIRSGAPRVGAEEDPPAETPTVEASE